MNTIRSIGNAPRRAAELGPMGVIRAMGKSLMPPPDTAEDGRDQWPSRAAFLLAAMGGCAGMGNLLRYPSVVYNNYGLQWYVPYLICVFLIAIPVLVLEIAIGNAYRGGSVVSFNNVSHRLKGVGMGSLFVGFVVSPYFVVNLAWLMVYFRSSFQSPLPWADDPVAYYNKVTAVIPEPIPGNYTSDGSGIQDWVEYTGTKVIGETVGWTVFVWFLVWVSIFRGVGTTGRVVYFTMGLPVVITIILIGRSCSLPNAADGIKLYFATWRSDALKNGSLWQTACGQVFFSTGVGFGYFTTYASYNRKHSNAVVDSFAIVASNVAFENIAAFAVFGVVGYLGMHPDPENPMGSFQVGFLTLPAAINEMPAPQLWAVLFFFTLVTLGYSSAFAMVDAVVTLLTDSHPRWSRAWIVTGICTFSFLFSLPYCAEFGTYLLTGVDRWINDVALVFVVWAECVAASVIYRASDIIEQVGLKSFATYNFAYFGGMIIGPIVAQAVSAEAGAGAGFAIYVVFTGIAIFLAKNPDARAPELWKPLATLEKSAFYQRFWFLAFYSGNQLRRDLNLIVGQGKNWCIPSFWGPLLRYIAAPALAIVYSFSYPNFYQLRNDPLHVLGFGIGHLALIIVGAAFIMPRWFDVFIPPGRRGEGKARLGANVNANIEEMEENARMENAKKFEKDGDSLNAAGVRDERDLAATSSNGANSTSSRNAEIVGDEKVATHDKALQ